MWAAFHICRSHLYFFLCLFCSYLLTFSYRSFASFLLYLQDFLYIIETETCTKSAWFPKAQSIPVFSLSKVYELFWVYSRRNDAFPWILFYLKLESMRYALPSPLYMTLTATEYTLLQICAGLFFMWASLVAQLVKNLPVMWETWVRFLGWEDPLEKGKATERLLTPVFWLEIPWGIVHSLV